MPAPKGKHMHIWLLFLRGVMPTGKNRVPMAQLRAALTQHGFSPVQTWIQSGNAVVGTTLDREETAQTVRRIIWEDIGADIPVVVKTADEAAALLADNPFAKEEQQDRVFYALSGEAIPHDKAQALVQTDFGEEKLAITKQCIYMLIPGSAARSKLSNVFLEKKLGITLTTRNRNTLSKLVQMGREVEALVKGR